MMGKRTPSGTLFDVGNVFPFRPKPGTFHAQLAEAAPRLFQDAAFQDLYDPRRGRYSVPPSELALLLLLQAEAGCSDAETLERSACDLRWCAVLRKAAGEPLCAKSTFQEFRARLVLEERADTVLKTSLEEAKRAGLLQGAALTLAIDTKPIIGRGAVLDTYNLLGSAIQKLATALAVAHGREAEAWAAAHTLSRYFAGRESSLKGSTEIDWADPAARTAFLSEIVGDARRLWRLAHDFLRDLAPAQSNAERTRERRVREPYELLGQLLRQDVQESTGPGGGPQARIKEGTAPERVPSVTDPEQRHGRKSQSKRFTGHKLRIGVDVASGLIAAVEVLAGNAGDAEAVLEAVAQAEANTERLVAETLGDCAYGGGETRQAFAAAGRTLHAKVPAPASNGTFFPKSAFTIDLAAGTVTCPGGQTTPEFRTDAPGNRIFQFGARCQDCPLRAQCTDAAHGRTVQVHGQEALLQGARAFQQSPAGRAKLRERVAVEHGLARMAQRGVGQAKYCGRIKTRLQMVLVAAVVNLRLVWNGAGAATGRDRGDGGPAGTGCWPRIGRWLHPGGGNRFPQPRWKRFRAERWLHGCGAAAC
jgi:transposase